MSAESPGEKIARPRFCADCKMRAAEIRLIDGRTWVCYRCEMRRRDRSHRV